MLGHRLDPTILREYDIRGIVGESLSADDVAAIGFSFAGLVKEKGGGGIAIGYDGRLSSPELEAAAVAGISSAGIEVFRAGCGPSPMLYFATQHFDADAGLMITGSHNPPDYNGIKMTILGRPFFGDDIQTLGRRVADGGPDTRPGAVHYSPSFAPYVARLLEDFRPGKDLKVAWDPGNGAASEVVGSLTAALPGSHFVINGEIDGTFPAHHPDPTVEANLEQLKVLVSTTGCDLGLAFDGDGDRIGVVDGDGHVLWGDQLLVLFAREVLADQPGATIIADIKASRLFNEEITRLGGNPVLWKTGHSHIKSKMAELNAPLAGEMSAHIFFKHRYYGYDDALYAAIRLLSILTVSETTLSDIRQALPAYINTPEIRFGCPEVRKFAVIDEVRARLKGRVGVLLIDGARVETDDGWWLLRASNTQSMLVARCESTTDEGLQRLKSELRAELELSGIDTPDF